MNDTPKTAVSFWPATAAALVAFAALYANGRSPVVLLLIVALLATHITPARISAGAITTWLLRLVAYGIIVTIYRERAVDQQFLAFDPAPTPLIGEIFAAEYVLHRWHRVSAVRAVTFISTGFVMLAASNSRDESQMVLFPYIAPVYFLLITQALRGYRNRLPVMPQRKGTRAALLMRAGAVALALLLGAASVQAVWAYRMALTDLGSRWLRETEMPERTGMSSSPQLGRMFDLQGSSQRVLRIAGDLDDPHLRGLSFDTYRAGGWGPDVSQRRLTAFDSPATPTGNRIAKVTSLARVARMHFAPLTASAILLEPGEPVQWAPDQGGPILSKDGEPLPYEIIGGEQYHQGPLAVPLTGERRQSYLQVPAEIDPKVRDLAKTIASSRASQPEKVQAIVAHLHKHHDYSLKVNPGPGDPISNFLLKDLDAHCEYFGSAAVILMRLQGIPARYVTGYYAHEGGGPGVTIVRQRDAHAWAEAWIDGIGWVTVDATPGSGRPDALAEKVPRTQAAWEWVQDKWAALLDWLAERTALQQIAMLISLAVGLGLWRLWQVYRKRRTAAGRTFSYASTDAALADLAARFDHVLRRNGVTVPPGSTWQECMPLEDEGQNGDGATGLDPRLVVGARSFVRVYNEARFGGNAAPDKLDQLEREITALETESNARPDAKQHT